MPSFSRAVTTFATLLSSSTLAFAQTPNTTAPAGEASAPAPTATPIPAATPIPVATPAPTAVAPQTATPAAAPATASPEPSPRKIVFDAPPAPTPNGGDSSRTFHYHDGFYARLGLNYGITGGGFAIGDGADQRRLDYTGSQLDLDLLLGGTPSDGLTIGGGLLMGSVLQPDVEVGGQNTATQNLSVLILGPFVDGFFTPSSGWHAGALLGLGALGETAETKGAGGFGGAVWLGYDRWVGADWSIGGQLRFMGIAASGNKPSDFSASALGLGLGFSVLYH